MSSNQTMPFPEGNKPRGVLKKTSPVVSASSSRAASPTNKKQLLRKQSSNLQGSRRNRSKKSSNAGSRNSSMSGSKGPSKNGSRKTSRMVAMLPSDAFDNMHFEAKVQDNTMVIPEDLPDRLKSLRKLDTKELEEELKSGVLPSDLRRKQPVDPCPSMEALPAESAPVTPQVTTTISVPVISTVDVDNQPRMTFPSVAGAVAKVDTPPSNRNRLSVSDVDDNILISPEVVNRRRSLIEMIGVETQQAGRRGSLTVSHDLAKKWCIWEKAREPENPDVKPSNDSFMKSLKNIKTFDSIERFMQVFNGVPPPSTILKNNKIVRAASSPSSPKKTPVRQRRASMTSLVDAKTDIESVMFFQEGVQPTWEDPAHKNGGQIQFSFKTDFPPDAIDEIWERLVYTIIGNMLPDGDMISGVKLSDRLPQRVKSWNPVVAVRLEIWMRDMPKGQANQLRKDLMYILHKELACGGHGIPTKAKKMANNVFKAQFTYAAPGECDSEESPVGWSRRRSSIVSELSNQA